MITDGRRCTKLPFSQRSMHQSSGSNNESRGRVEAREGTGGVTCIEMRCSRMEGEFGGGDGVAIGGWGVVWRDDAAKNGA